MTAEWDAEIVSEIPGEMTSWRSVEGSEVENSGTIWLFAAPAVFSRNKRTGNN